MVNGSFPFRFPSNRSFPELQHPETVAKPRTSSPVTVSWMVRDAEFALKSPTSMIESPERVHNARAGAFLYFASLVRNCYGEFRSGSWRWSHRHGHHQSSPPAARGGWQKVAFLSHQQQEPRAQRSRAQLSVCSYGVSRARDQCKVSGCQCLCERGASKPLRGVRSSGTSYPAVDQPSPIMHDQSTRERSSPPQRPCCLLTAGARPPSGRRGTRRAYLLRISANGAAACFTAHTA